MSNTSNKLFLGHVTGRSVMRNRNPIFSGQGRCCVNGMSGPRFCWGSNRVITRSRPCLGCVRARSGLCFYCIKVVFRLFHFLSGLCSCNVRGPVRYIRVVFRLYQGCLHSLTGLCSGFISFVFRLYQGCVQAMSGLCLDYFRVGFGLCQGSPVLDTITDLYSDYIKVVVELYPGYI